MNFQLALLWTALFVPVGFFVFIFYEEVNYYKDNKNEMGNKNKKRNARKPAIPAGKTTNSKTNQDDTSISTQIYGISHDRSGKYL